MKLCCAVAVAVLVLSLCSQGESQFGPDRPKCCFQFYTKYIPARRIKAYQLTPIRCPILAVIFTTTTNKELCVNPNDKTVQDIMEKLDNLWVPGV